AAGGTILAKGAKAFREPRGLGRGDGDLKIYTAQAAGCAPVVQALHRGTELIAPVKPATIAKSIAIGNPADGFYVLKAVRESGGWGEAVTDEEIVEGIRLLARTEGIFTEPAGGTTVAVTKKLIDQGRIPRDESIVVAITGNGYKTLEAVLDSVAQPFRIPARLADFEELHARLEGGRGGVDRAGDRRRCLSAPMPSVAALAPPASPAEGPLAALSVARLVGNTPLVEIRHVRDGVAPGVRILAKLEGFNPGGSVKDR